MTFTPRALLGDEKPDPTPPADEADMALRRIHGRANLIPQQAFARGQARDVELLRDALADRITPKDAETLRQWGEHYASGDPTFGERALIARLGRIADRETDR